MPRRPGGRAAISGDRKYLDARTVVSHAKLVCAGRSLPRLTASNDGLWCRVRVW